MLTRGKVRCTCISVPTDSRETEVIPAADLYVGLEYYEDGAIRQYFLRNAEFQTHGYSKE
jgi:hypothetical protein